MSTSSSTTSSTHTKTQSKAVIYARVSGAKQVREGDGLASQETRCREYANGRGHQVIEVFRDDFTGKEANRPAMMAMVAYLRKHRRDNYVIIIDDISRLARDIEAHKLLRRTLKETGAGLESPSIEFGDDPDSILVEHLLASVAQHQREKNAEQTFNRMRARLMNGYWVFQAPIGYAYEKTPGHGKLLVRNEPYATIITEALEGYASGRFQTQVEVKRFLEQHDILYKNKHSEIPQQRVTEILTRPIYAGIIKHENWGLKLIEGKHEALISFETYQKIQKRRLSVAKVPARKNLNEDFPLRGFVTCGCCEKPLTACWSKGRSAKYPYYLCDTKGCPEYRKSIRKEKIEGEFEVLLKEMRPSEELFVMAFNMFRDLWDAKLASTKQRTTSMKMELAQIERKVSLFLERIVEASSATIIRTYEDKVTELGSGLIKCTPYPDSGQFYHCHEVC